MAESSVTSSVPINFRVSEDVRTALDDLAQRQFGGNKTAAFRAALEIAGEVYSHRAGREAAEPIAALAAYVRAGEDVKAGRLRQALSAKDCERALGRGYTIPVADELENVRFAFQMMQEDRGVPTEIRELSIVLLNLVFALRQLDERVMVVEAVLASPSEGAQ